jgi:hypothetical protein
MAALSGCGALALLDAPRAIASGVGSVVKAVEGEKGSGKGDGARLRPQPEAAVSPVEGGEYPSESDFYDWIHTPSMPLSEDEAARLPPRLKPLAELKTRADEGDVQAMYDYGYRLGDLEKAWVWYCPAAHKGHAESQYALANYYRWGHSPMQQNSIKSYLWRTLSLNGGDPRAASARHFTQEMTADQIAETKRLVTKWKPNPAECKSEAKLAAD